MSQPVYIIRTFLVDFHHISAMHLAGYPVNSQFPTGTTFHEVARLIHETITEPDHMRFSRGAWIFTKKFPGLTGWNFSRQQPCFGLRVCYVPEHNGFPDVITTAYPVVLWGEAGTPTTAFFKAKNTQRPFSRPPNIPKENILPKLFSCCYKSRQ